LHNYQFTVIEDLIKENLPATELKTEIERIKQDLNNILCTSDNPKVYFQYHQHKLLLLMDKVAARKNQKIYNLLDDLLSFMQSDFAFYMDTKLIAPVSYQLAIKKQLATAPDFMKKVDHECGKILTTAFTKEDRLTYEQLDYLKELHEELNILLDEHEDRIQMKLLDLLIYLNFNDKRFYDYSINSIEKELEEVPTNQQLIRLKWYQARINSSPVKEGVNYSNTSMKLKELLQSWLTQMIDYLEYVEKRTTDANLTKQSTPKLHIGRSIKELACVVNLLVETEIITNKNKTEVAEFFALHISTIQTDDISKDSLLRKMYNIDPNIKRSVRDGLLELANFSKNK
jgi:hypothetical protein